MIDNENNKKEAKKLTLKEKLKDKREKAKIELILYGIFFVGVIIFVRVFGSITSPVENINPTQESFISSIIDNYEYDIQIIINDATYAYHGKVLGNNRTINLQTNDQEKFYYQANKKYYVLESGNYILTDEKEVYPYLDYRYLSIDTIKEYIDISTKEGNIYRATLSDIILGSESDEYITIYIEEGDKNIVIDYTALFQLTDENIEKLLVNITFDNINNILSLEE